MPGVAAGRTRPIVLALLLLAVIGCPGITSTGDSGGTVTFNSLHFGTCARSASPLPGWAACSATISLNVTKTVTSGYVSVFVNYPDGGAFYHGQLHVTSGKPGTISIPVINDYISHCVTSYATTVDVYDGPTSAQTAPLLASIATTLTATCG